MTDFSCKLFIKTSPERAYFALTTQIGLESWWTKTCTVSSNVSEISRFEFPIAKGKMFNVMKNKKLIPTKIVHWQCLQHYHPKDDKKTFEKFNEWVGTEIIFQLKPKEESTLLHFIHKGLNPNLECYKECKKGWIFFLQTSLKNYLETGTGQPYTCF